MYAIITSQTVYRLFLPVVGEGLSAHSSLRHLWALLWETSCLGTVFFHRAPRWGYERHWLLAAASPCLTGVLPLPCGTLSYTGLWPTAPSRTARWHYANATGLLLTGCCTGCCTGLLHCLPHWLAAMPVALASAFGYHLSPWAATCPHLLPPVPIGCHMSPLAATCPHWVSPTQ